MYHVGSLNTVCTDCVLSHVTTALNKHDGRPAGFEGWFSGIILTSGLTPF